MSQIIEEFRSSHIEISDMLLQVAKLGITSEEGKKKLFHAKSTLLAHLKKEDEELYPILWKEAENDQDLKLKLESFARDIDAVTRTIFAFFEKYSSREIVSSKILVEDSGYPKEYTTASRLSTKTVSSASTASSGRSSRGVTACHHKTWKAVVIS